MAKQILEQWEREDAARLKAIFNEKKGRLDITQEKMAELLGANHQSAASNYLNAHTRLNIKVAMIFARVLQCNVEDFSPTLAAEIGGAKGTGAAEDELARIASELSDSSKSFLLEMALSLRNKEVSRTDKD